jgi:CDP-L-myo-inositol myo-inositolphosphotransferase
VKCLIIAAGEGSRLSNRGDSKPLVILLGLSLIERVILTAHKSGFSEFYVVTGYNAQKVGPFLDKVSRDRDIKITNISNEKWEKGNGLSVLKAKKVLNENFILLMTDHIFDQNILKELKREKIKGGEVMLAVDHKNNSNNLVDIDDVTKVCVNNGKAVDIGKYIPKYNAYDTGIFLCSPAIFNAIETSISTSNDNSLTGGVKILAEKGKVKTFDIKDYYWIDIDDEKAFRRAEKLLCDKLKKSSDGPVSRYLNRPISTRFTKYLLKSNISPNQITFFSFILFVIASIFFFLGSYIALFAGAVLAQMASIIDGCDGEVARLKYKESNFGKWFDAVLDRYADAFLLFGLTYYVFAPGKNLLFLFIGFLAIIGSFMNSYTADKYDGLMKDRLGVNKSYFRIGRDIRTFIIFIGAISNQVFITLLFIALLTNIENIRRIVIFYRNG